MNLQLTLQEIEFKFRAGIISESASSYLREDATEELGSIINLPIKDFVKKYKNIASNPKVNAIVSAGLNDGNITDEKMNVSSGTIKVSRLFPTQNEIGTEASLKFMITNEFGNLEQILGGNAKFPTPIIIYNSKYIIDGHHRWSQAYVVNPQSSVPVYNIQGDVNAEDILKIVHLAISADLKTLPLSSAKGDNMLKVSKSKVTPYINHNLNDSARKAFLNGKDLKTDNEIVDYIWKNIETMQKNNRPPSWAPDRDYMPQTGKSKNFDKLLKKGSVNFIDPKEDDIEKNLKLK